MAESKLHLKPAAGLIVRDPQTGTTLAEKGERKPDTQYWRRRLRDGDVVDLDAEKKAPAKVAEKAAAKNNGGASK